MRNISINARINNIAALESEYSNLLKEYSSKKDKILIASPFFFLPPEIFSSFGIIPLKIPEFILRQEESFRNTISTIFNKAVISGPDCVCNKPFSNFSEKYIFSTPAGFGEDAAVSLHNEISAILKNLFNIDIKSVNISLLQEETAVYEKLRRAVRSISALRAENRHLLSNTEMKLIFETALTLPPEIALEYIEPLLEEMKKTASSDPDFKITGMLYGGKTIPAEIADCIEEIGILIVEDDSCSGRRLFDISLNPDSEFIFYEILDAYSYRPLSPCLRNVKERHELLYKLLRNYNIHTLLFYKDETCGISSGEIDYLRKKMMRDGIDPVVINSSNYREIIEEYVKRI